MNASSSVIGLKEDFYSECYVTFSKALNAVSLAKIRDDKWKFVGYFGFYLSATKNSYARGIVKKFQHETPIEVSSPSSGDKTVYLSDLSKQGIVKSAEDTVIEADEQERISKALARCQTRLWTEEQNRIFALRAKALSIKAVCAEMGISSWRYNKLLTEMKASLDKETELAS
jgi:hypothetical protein